FCAAKIRSGPNLGTTGRISGGGNDDVKTMPSLSTKASLGAVVVDPAADLLAQPAGLDVLHQQRRGAELLAQRAVQVLENRQAGGEADQIDQPRTPPPMGAT